VGGFVTYVGTIARDRKVFVVTAQSNQAIDAGGF
jgi:hypothetical protein